MEKNQSSKDHVSELISEFMKQQFPKLHGHWARMGRGIGQGGCSLGDTAVGGRALLASGRG